MNILVVGTGYVGLVTGTCLSEFGHNVSCLDIVEEKIESLKKGILPIYEPGLEELVHKNYKKGNLKFTSSYKEGIKGAELVFIAVGTPPKDDGSADLQYVLEAGRNIAEHMSGYAVVINKSTVPVGTGRKVKAVISEVLKKRGLSFSVDVVSNPEFLREGVAVNDFMKPDRIVIGAENEKAAKLVKNAYLTPYNSNQMFVLCGLETAEMIKYASNAFLATKISFINEMSVICEAVGADVKDVALGMGLDHRINKFSLYAGPGYGGSCFPKDTKALIKIAEDCGCTTRIVRAAEEANEFQKLRMVDKIEQGLGSLKEKTIAILGLAFKPETDDVREAPATVIIKNILKRGGIVRAYDPIAIENAAKYALNGDEVYYAKNEYDVCDGCDAVVIVTEWIQFKNLDFKRIAGAMKNKMIFDFRNMLDKEYLKGIGFEVMHVGR